jgi:hypothetical protein
VNPFATEMIGEFSVTAEAVPPVIALVPLPTESVVTVPERVRDACVELKVA